LDTLDNSARQGYNLIDEIRKDNYIDCHFYSGAWRLQEQAQALISNFNFSGHGSSRPSFGLWLFPQDHAFSGISGN
jgi:hypothetical protein